MSFQVLSSLLALTIVSLSFLEVQGILYKEMDSLISIKAHQTAFHEGIKAVIKGETSVVSMSYKDGTLEEEEIMMVVRKRRRTMSNSKITSISTKKPQQVHHHWMPRIHEDYYGPKHHKPTHH